MGLSTKLPFKEVFLFLLRTPDNPVDCDGKRYGYLTAWSYQIGLNETLLHCNIQQIATFFLSSLPQLTGEPLKIQRHSYSSSAAPHLILFSNAQKGVKFFTIIVVCFSAFIIIPSSLRPSNVQQHCVQGCQIIVLMKQFARNCIVFCHCLTALPSPEQELDAKKN